ncbi:hypothetical protein BG006_010464 [Podila minutissima]|uniref:Peroxin/Ferlin domain-containing protein n=1 Tax=Podila minutissima TaxID=64525 RepID=A0A9P5VPR3_9FUNG|nr:hypothetical protein BG006_010464 [Podila minutissima]
MNTTTTNTARTTHIHKDVPTEVAPSTSLPFRTDSERTPSESPEPTVMDIQQLSAEEAQREAERAAEKINRKIKPLSKFKEMRQSITNTSSEDDEDNKGKRKGKDIESNDSPPSEIVLSIDGTETPPIQETTSASGEAPIDPSHQPSEASISRLVYNKSKKSPKQPKSKLIEIEPARLVDAQCARGDRRFFQLPSDPPPEGDFVYEFLYQHQRGAFFLGTPKFSSKSLLPVDPDEWTNSRWETSAMDVTDFELPDPSWEWVHRSWLVDMTGDVDEDGWEYAMTFHGSPWHGNYEIFRSFARRRRWLRLRKRKPSPFPQVLEEEGRECSKGSKNGMLAPSKPAESVDLYKILKKARSDREKLAYTAQYVVRYPGDFEDLEARLDKYLNLLDYESSRREFLSLLAAYGRTKAVLEGTSNLGYYSDLKVIQQKVGKS